MIGEPVAADDPLVIAMVKMKEELHALTRPRKILFVEDNEIMRRMFCRWVEEFNCIVSLAPDGEIGLAKALAETFDLIILDITLPKMDGIECFRRIRKALGDTPPITFFTGTLDDKHGEAIEEIGFAAFIRKPQQFNQRFIISFLHTFHIFRRPKDLL